MTKTPRERIKEHAKKARFQSQAAEAVKMAKAMSAALSGTREAVEPVASIVPKHCTGAAFIFDGGSMRVNKDGSGYIVVPEDEFQLEDDRCEGPDGPEGSVHWIARFQPGELDSMRDWLNGEYTAERKAVDATWPDFAAPSQYDNPADGWSDPQLPDFRLIWSVARGAGYAIGLHGSMKRDCDLIAVPWVNDAQPPEDLIEELCRALNAKQVGEVEQKPHGRVALTLQIDGYVKPIDLSIYAAPPSDPVGQGAVTVKPLEWKPSTDGSHHAVSLGLVYHASSTGQWGCTMEREIKDGGASMEAAKAAAQADYERRILSVLSPAPEAGSDEVERLKAELAEAVRRGEDQWTGWVKETAARKAAEARENTLRDQLGKMREELACTYEELIEHTGDDMNDSRQKRVDELLRALSDAAEGGQ